MKRNDMIKILKDSFHYHMECQCCFTDHVMYSRILKELEQSGMQPPKVKWQELVVGDDGKEYMLDFAENEWESENEKK